MALSFFAFFSAIDHGRRQAHSRRDEKTIRFAPFTLLILSSGFLAAKTENGLSLEVQKVTLDAEKDRDAFLGWDKVKRALGDWPA